jgi:hypothetical protein
MDHMMDKISVKFLLMNLELNTLFDMMEEMVNKYNMESKKMVPIDVHMVNDG